MPPVTCFPITYSITGQGIRRQDPTPRTYRVDGKQWIHNVYFVMPGGMVDMDALITSVITIVMEDIRCGRACDLVLAV